MGTNNRIHAIHFLHLLQAQNINKDHSIVQPIAHISAVRFAVLFRLGNMNDTPIDIAQKNKYIIRGKQNPLHF